MSYLRINDRRKGLAIGDRATCKHCGQEIEWSGRGFGWTDRGGNRQCVPFRDRATGEISQPTTKHARYVP